MKWQLSIFSILLIFSGCSSPKIEAEKVTITEVSPNTSHASALALKENIPEPEPEPDSINPYAPCQGDCKASFHFLGEKINSDSTMDIYISGKGIDWNVDCCIFFWGEDINNRPSPPGIKKTRIHLMDLDEFTVPKKDSDYGDNKLKKFVIAIAHSDSTGLYEIYDPFKTGKYPKPK